MSGVGGDLQTCRGDCCNFHAARNSSRKWAIYEPSELLSTEILDKIQDSRIKRAEGRGAKHGLFLSFDLNCKRIFVAGIHCLGWDDPEKRTSKVVSLDASTNVVDHASKARARRFNEVSTATSVAPG